MYEQIAMHVTHVRDSGRVYDAGGHRGLRCAETRCARLSARHPTRAQVCAESRDAAGRCRAACITPESHCRTGRQRIPHNR